MTIKKSSKSSLFNCFKNQEPVHEPKPEKRTTEPSMSRNSVKRISHMDISSSDDLSKSLPGSNLYVFTFAELKVITQSFASCNFLGEGGFGPVHKGFIDDKLRPGLKAQPVAVKCLNLEGSQGHTEWLTEVVFLAQLRHPHLVKLIGYCYEDEHRLLVYEYMPRGSLESRLFQRYSIPLPWSTRMKIALGAAKGLTFLHEAENPVIYRDFKTSNILLDADYNAKLSDFGLAKDGPDGDDTHVSTRVMGTYGYTAPEYLRTGRLTIASDVYSFGVVLVELLTARKAMDESRPNREKSLAEWARPLLKSARKLSRILDPRLEGQYSETGAQKAAKLAYQCLSHRPKERPTMSVIVDTLEPLTRDFDETPFVYTAPTTLESPKKEAHKVVEKDNNDHHHHHQQHDRRLGRTKSGVVHCETDLDKNLSARTDSPE
ncbi:hypothetical protein SSX86_004270 [Deinandra increscens subsp. villosa]|uniref:non-specific serine/threonine protein kinase n=1 Tax=Deinandra increscens subsp. villosa TaxID=3103831 RepID=A0AAP0DIX5_9ASTR